MIKRLKLFLDFSSFMAELSWMTLTRPPYMLSSGSIIMTLLSLVDVAIMLPINIIFNVALLFFYYLPFSPEMGNIRIELFREVIMAEKELRAQIKKQNRE